MRFQFHLKSLLGFVTAAAIVLGLAPGVPLIAPQLLPSIALTLCILVYASAPTVICLALRRWDPNRASIRWARIGLLGVLLPSLIVASSIISGDDASGSFLVLTVAYWLPQIGVIALLGRKRPTPVGN